MDPVELERQPRGSVEVDQSADDYGDDAEDEDELMTNHGEGGASMSSTSSYIKQEKDAKMLKAPKAPKLPKIKEPKAPKEHKPPKGYIPKKLAPKTEGTSDIEVDVDMPPAGSLDENMPLSAISTASSASQSNQTRGGSEGPGATGPRPRPFHCTYDDCKKVFIDAIQLERHLERHGPKELECGIDGCRKRFSAQMLLRRHQSMVHKRRSPAVPVSGNTGLRYHKAAAAAVAAGPLDPLARLAPPSSGSAFLSPAPSNLRSPAYQEDDRAGAWTSSPTPSMARYEEDRHYELDDNEHAAPSSRS
jgi:hypothetical protein